jgi:hypothetical protein
MNANHHTSGSMQESPNAGVPAVPEKKRSANVPICQSFVGALVAEILARVSGPAVMEGRKC